MSELDKCIARKLSEKKIKKGNHKAIVEALRKCVMGEAMIKRYWETKKT